MKKKLAIVISGAVSLGSYEAGVVYEFIEAIAQHNLSAADHERIEIDVITGSSAGGITAAILAKALFFHNQSLREPYSNPLYNTWVEDVNLLNNPNSGTQGLLDLDNTRLNQSILNDEVLVEIAKQIFPDDPYAGNGRYEITGQHPSLSESSPELLTGITMSNLNGFPVSIKLNRGLSKAFDSLPEDNFTYSQYKDRFVCRWATGCQLEEWEEYLNDDNQTIWKARTGKAANPSWEMIRNIALSSGAFPFAFPVRLIKRYSDNDNSLNLTPIYQKRNSYIKKQRLGEANNQQRRDWTGGRYIYTDGGVFENEPIGLAIDLVDTLKNNSNHKETPDTYERFFLFIAPSNRKADDDPFLSIKEANDLSHISVAKALASAIMGQSRFQQWITKAGDKSLNVISITSGDERLLGDTFSAFAGFLSKKFRAYDYNIGRAKAQEKLEELRRISFINFDHLQPISWPLQTKDIKTWEEAEAKLKDIAAIKYRVQEKQLVRDPVQELQGLLKQLEKDEILQLRVQVKKIVKSLTEFLFDISHLKSNNLSHRHKLKWPQKLSRLIIIISLLISALLGRQSFATTISFIVDKWLEFWLLPADGKVKCDKLQ